MTTDEETDIPSEREIGDDAVDEGPVVGTRVLGEAGGDADGELNVGTSRGDEEEGADSGEVLLGTNGLLGPVDVLDTDLDGDVKRPGFLEVGALEQHLDVLSDGDDNGGVFNGVRDLATEKRLAVDGTSVGNVEFLANGGEDLLDEFDLAGHEAVVDVEEEEEVVLAATTDVESAPRRRRG